MIRDEQGFRSHTFERDKILMLRVRCKVWNILLTSTILLVPAIHTVFLLFLGKKGYCTVLTPIEDS